MSRPASNRSTLTQHVTKTALRARFGPEALISRFGAIWVMHVDRPTEAEIQERLAEVEHDMLEPEDCAGCDLMRPQAGDTVIFDTTGVRPR